MTVTAYLGPEGTFAEQAAPGLVPAGELRSAVSVHAAIAALRARQVDAACGPVENSVEGSVPATLDAMAEGEPVLAAAPAGAPAPVRLPGPPRAPAPRLATVGPHPRPWPP